MSGEHMKVRRLKDKLKEQEKMVIETKGITLVPLNNKLIMAKYEYIKSSRCPEQEITLMPLNNKLTPIKHGYIKYSRCI